MVTIGARLQAIGRDNFFDSDKVKKLLGEAKRKKLSGFGAHVRTTGRQLIRPAAIANRKERRAAKKAGAKAPKPIFVPSRPGEAPRTRRPGAPIKRILFGYEPGGGPDGGGNVVIGFGLIAARASDVPSRLEHSGEFRSKRSGRMIRVAKRPTMAPALEKEKVKAAPMFADSL